MNRDFPQGRVLLASRLLRALAASSSIMVVLALGCGGTSSDPKPDDPPTQEPLAAASERSPAEASLSSGARSATSADGTYRVAWEPIGGVIPDAEPFAIAIEVARVDGVALAEDVVVLVDAEMPHHGHGMNLIPVVRRGPRTGTFVAEGMLFHMSGAWVVAVDVGENGVSERTQWVIDVQ